MYLFSRSVRPGPGNPEKQLDWALRITEKVNQISEMPVSLWTTVFSPNAGQFVWSSILEDLLTMETTFEKLFADRGYASLVEEGGTHASGDAVDDGLLQFLFVDPKAADIESKYAGVVRTTAAPGGLVKGMELGVETAQLAGKITGSATSFASAVTGPYGMVEWITLYAVDRRGAALRRRLGGRRQLRPEGGQGTEQGLPAGGGRAGAAAPHRVTEVRWSDPVRTASLHQPGRSAGAGHEGLAEVGQRVGEVRGAEVLRRELADDVRLEQVEMPLSECAPDGAGALLPGEGRAGQTAVSDLRCRADTAERAWHDRDHVEVGGAWACGGRSGSW